LNWLASQNEDADSTDVTQDDDEIRLDADSTDVTQDDDEIRLGADSTDVTQDDQEIPEDADSTDVTQDDDEIRMALDSTELTQDKFGAGIDAGLRKSSKIPSSEIVVRTISVERTAPLADLPADMDAAFGQWLSNSGLAPSKH
jgi:hypothetical protein